ncbi:MAG: TolC family protein, partial [Bacteroidaceae bacterium]|nr:TolC family protein [Bacteroidaceae bacterium]
MNYKNVKQNTTRLIIFILINISALSLKAQSAWTLKDCIDYALENNIQLKQSKLTTLQNKLSVEQSKASLFPALSFSTNQNMSWRPFSQSTINLTNGTMTSTKSTVNYNGSYGLNANMTLWNGGRNTNTIKQNEYAAEMSELDTEQSENSIMEQITQLYVQMLYQKEAVNVCEAILKSSELQRDRAKTMVNVGTLAKVELMQLEAQTTQDQYNLINAKSQLENYRFQLKQLLELPEQDNFDISETQTTDDQIITPIPSKQEVYNVALAQRPEIQSGKLNVESNKLSIKIAKAGYLPSVNLNASVGTNNASGTHTALGEQIKNNLSNSIGLSLSVPIFDQRQNKTNVHKA